MADINICLNALKTCAISAAYVDWICILAIVLTLMVTALGILFAVSRAMNRKDWEALARAELYQTGVAAVWVVLIIVAATSACSVTCMIVDDENPFIAASTYLSTVSTRLQGMAETLFNLPKDIRFASAIYIGFLDVSGNPWQGCDVIAESLETLALMLTPFIGSLIIQQYAMIMISNIAFQLLLPMGIIIRLIPPLRQAGAFLMALAFALYIVFPLTYVFAERVTSGVLTDPEQIDSPGTNCSDPNVMDKILKNVGNALPQAVFFPALSTIITIAAARALSKVFSYDFQEIR